MQNEVWDEFAGFLNGLRCGNVKRYSYIHLPEMEEAEENRKLAKNQLAETFKTMDSIQQEAVKNYVEALENQSFILENRAYCQGYADCIQLLSGIGLLKGSPDIETLIREIKG